MGAWGPGSFENDDALDFVAEIETLADIEAALCALGSEYIEVDEAARVVVAAECVAALRGHPSPALPDELARRLPAMGQCPIDLYSDARENLSAVMSRGELLELWTEEGSGVWNRAITELMERLNQPAAKVKAPRRKKKPTPNPSPCMFCDQPMGEGAFHMLDVVLSDDEFSTSRRGGWVHLQCLNAALHPKHMIQNWQFDEELLDHFMNKRDGAQDS